jgi:hypothetical protein
MDDYDGSEHHHHHHHHSESGYEESGTSSRHHHHHHASESEDSSGGESGGEHHHHHHHSVHPSQRASQASSLCVVAAFLSFAFLAVAHLIAKNLSALPNPALNAAAAGIAAAAFVFGFYAEVVQIRYWDPKVRVRLFVGMPVAVLVLIVAGVNFYRQYQPVPHATLRPAGAEPPEAVTNDTAAAVEEPAPGAPEDTSLFKPGWSGEGELDGVIATVNSYNENATESRQFNRRLIRKKVAYAVLSIMNKGEKPVTLTSFQLTVTEREGMTRKSLSAKALLNENAAANGDQLALLVTPRTLAPGAMLANIPVCLPEGFAWDSVISAAFPLGEKDVVIQGRMLTAEQREALLVPEGEKASATNAPAKPADKYFENL